MQSFLSKMKVTASHSAPTCSLWDCGLEHCGSYMLLTFNVPSYNVNSFAKTIPKLSLLCLFAAVCWDSIHDQDRRRHMNIGGYFGGDAWKHDVLVNPDRRGKLSRPQDLVCSHSLVLERFFKCQENVCSGEKNLGFGHRTSPTYRNSSFSHFVKA